MFRIANVGSPPSLSRARGPETVDAALRPRHQGRVETVASQDVHHPIDGVPFADAAGIEFHARMIEPYRLACRIELDELVSDVPARGRQCLRRRNAAGPSVEAPGSLQGTDRDIERSFGPAALLETDGYQSEQLRGYRNRVMRGPAVDEAPLAVRAIARQQAIEAAHLVEGGPDRSFHPIPVAPVQRDGERRSHRADTLAQPQDLGVRGRDHDGP